MAFVSFIPSLGWQVFCSNQKWPVSAPFSGKNEFAAQEPQPTIPSSAAALQKVMFLTLLCLVAFFCCRGLGIWRSLARFCWVVGLTSVVWQQTAPWDRKHHEASSLNCTVKTLRLKNKHAYLHAFCWFSMVEYVTFDYDMPEECLETPMALVWVPWLIKSGLEMWNISICWSLARVASLMVSMLSMFAASGAGYDMGSSQNWHIATKASSEWYLPMEPRRSNNIKTYENEAGQLAGNNLERAVFMNHESSWNMITEIWKRFIQKQDLPKQSVTSFREQSATLQALSSAVSKNPPWMPIYVSKMLKNGRVNWCQHCGTKVPRKLISSKHCSSHTLWMTIAEVKLQTLLQKTTRPGCWILSLCEGCEKEAVRPRCCRLLLLLEGVYQSKSRPHIPTSLQKGMNMYEVMKYHEKIHCLSCLGFWCL